MTDTADTPAAASEKTLCKCGQAMADPLGRGMCSDCWLREYQSTWEHSPVGAGGPAGYTGEDVPEVPANLPPVLTEADRTATRDRPDIDHLLDEDGWLPYDFRGTEFWQMPFDVQMPAVWVDHPEQLREAGHDPEALVRSALESNERMAKERGVVLAQTLRRGTDIIYQYRSLEEAKQVWAAKAIAEIRAEERKWPKLKRLWEYLKTGR